MSPSLEPWVMVLTHEFEFSSLLCGGSGGRVHLTTILVPDGTGGDDEWRAAVLGALIPGGLEGVTLTPEASLENEWCVLCRVTPA